MKTIYSVQNGAITITEDAGVFSLNISEKASVGGGEVAGIVKVQGEGSVQLDAATALKLGEALLNSHLPSSVQSLAAVIEGVANQAIAAIE